MFSVFLFIRFFKQIKEVSEILFWIAVVICSMIAFVVLGIIVWIHTYLWPIFIIALWVGAYTALGLTVIAVTALSVYGIKRRRRAAEGHPMAKGIVRGHAGAVASAVGGSRVMGFPVALAVWWWRRSMFIHIAVLIWFLVVCRAWLVFIIPIFLGLMVITTIFYFIQRHRHRLSPFVSDKLVPTISHIWLAFRAQRKWHRLMRYWYIAQSRQDLALRHPQQSSRKTHAPRGRAFPTPRGVGVYFVYPSGIGEENFTSRGKDDQYPLAPKDGIARDLHFDTATIESAGNHAILWLERGPSPLAFVP